ncbi:hypothetical protein COMNV_01346 [Commensalibacter sp. Nvir]|uniref:hypothetical protein n=1 Tax=Commensalibacter sp. Nvir TaxID=3069817 RepID=UPI002D3C50C7|nr:hypothetical protein COMNV_01346 [Commensalibacter sp. Nvir]
MFKKNYALALTCALLSFAAFNTISYAKITDCGSDQIVSGIRFDAVGYNPTVGRLYVSRLDNNLNEVNYFNGINDDSMSNALVEPLELAAYFSGTPVTFCYATAKDSSGTTRYWIHKFALQRS